MPMSALSLSQTFDQPATQRMLVAEPTHSPGLVVVFSGNKPRFCVLPIGRETTLGRETPALEILDDPCMSRRHARVSLSGGSWVVEDLDSRNGTYLDGVAVQGRVVARAPRVLRIGTTLLAFVSNADLLAEGAVELVSDGFVVGPTLRQAWDRVEAVARSSPTLHVFGETGAGKEAAAARFHAMSSRHGGPFVAVNCATIPANLAERLLFGARKGAFSGAGENVDGYVQTAHRGTLFLDEIGELEASVQAKLLRVLQTGEVLSLGASRPTSVHVAICSATHRDLRAEVAARRFREDLFYRISRPMVELPALRDRPEDIPEIIVKSLHEVSPDLSATTALIEAALLRPWPGNVRELMVAVADAGRAALVRGAASVTALDLGFACGERLEAAPVTSAAQPPGPPTREMIAAAVAACHGNVSKAARVLRVHRNSLRRWIQRHGLGRVEMAVGTAS